MANGRANRGARLGAGAAWAEARALGGKARFPCGFERQVAPRLARAVDYGGNAQGPVLRRRGRVGNPPPPNRRGRASQGKGLRQPQALRTGAGFHPLTPGGPFPLMVLRAPSDREALGRPGMPQQALASADWADIAPAGGVVKALWQREPMPLEATPGERVPSIQRSPHRVQSLVTATRPLTVHVAVPPSAYPLAFPGAWAAETIPPPPRLRWPPTPPWTLAGPGRGARGGGYAVPGGGVPLHGGSHCLPGDFGMPSGAREAVSRLSPCPFGAKPIPHVGLCPITTVPQCVRVPIPMPRCSTGFPGGAELPPFTPASRL